MSFLENDLERMILDEAAEPKALPFALLAEITDDFSDELEIGRGGFAVVYKAVLENGDVAVKRLSSNAYLYENEFHREIECLMKVKHKNIVRFFGYCADTQGNVTSYNGKFVMADLQHRLLCFEYLPKGSLHDYIDDASGGLGWTERYKIIKGICEGLCYLHQKNILHLDLKPTNILLDENMQPKITDFGLSRCFEEDQTRVTATKVGGTIGYLAPEFTSHEITYKFDLYSLGIMIIEILTGKKGYQAIEDVLESWSSRLQISQDSPEWAQIKVCAEIGIQRTKFNPGKRPCSMKHVMDRLAETEGAEVIPAAEPPAEPTELLSVHPLELCFPFEYMKRAPCSLYLRNNTSELVAFRIIVDDKEQQQPSNCFSGLLLNGIVPPRTTYTLVVATNAEKVQTSERNGLILQSTTLVLGDRQMINKFRRDPDNFFEEVKDTGMINMVQEVRLKAVRTPATEIVTLPSLSSKPISPKIKIFTNHSINSLDTNHHRQWIIAADCGRRIRIWNHETQELMRSFKVSDEQVNSIKCIARKQWFAIGTSDGLIHVYNYETKMRKVTSFNSYQGSVQSLAIHPTQPYLLSVHDHEMVLWDWEKGWERAQTFEKEYTRHTYQVVFNKNDTIAGASGDPCVKIWSLNFRISTHTFAGHLKKVNYLDFFTSFDQEYLVTGSDDQTVKIWDMQKKKCVCTLEASLSPVTAVLYEPKHHILITGSEYGCIYLWRATNSRINSRSFRLEEIVNIGFGGAVKSLTHLMGSVVIKKSWGIVSINIDNNLEESRDDYCEPLSSAYNYSTTGPAIDTIAKVMSTSSELLDVALERISILYEPNESISWLVHLTNSTGKHVTFNLMDKRSDKALVKLPLYGIVPSACSCSLIVSATKEELAKEAETCFDLILQSCTLWDDMCAVLFDSQYACDNFFEDAKEMGIDVHEVAVLLKADYHVPQLEEAKSKPAMIPSGMKIISMKNTDDELYSIDTHPLEQWIVTGHASGYVYTWDHETQGPMDKFRVSWQSVTSVKVIARKQWILAQEKDGFIYVYDCTRVKEMQKMTSFKDDVIYGRSLAVHPTQPYVVSASGKLWDWDKGWERIQAFSPSITNKVGACAFNPKDTNSFVCASQVLKVWSSLDSPESDYTLSGHLKTVNCLDFFTRDDGQYLITGSEDCTAKIWDWRKKECIHTMEVMSRVTCVLSLPDRPYLVTGSKHGTVQLWSSIDFRLLRTVIFSSNDRADAFQRYWPVLGLTCTMGSRRVVVGQKHAISIIEIDDAEEVVASEGNNKISVGE